MDIAEAIAAPRIFRSFPSNETCVEERGISKDNQQLLEMMGYELYISDNDGWTFGRAMGIFVDLENGLYYGAADPCGYQGAASGY
jgi:gamma-glutamyltranspeptidase